MKIGVLALARPTFDVAFAEKNLAAMLAVLDRTCRAAGREITGPRALLFDADAAETAVATMKDAGVDFLLLLQVTFTDASSTVAAASALEVPIGIWAIPEPREGGRLRLNSFCGLNLAAHALGLNGRRFSWVYADPAGGEAGAELDAMLNGARQAGRAEGRLADRTSPEAREIVTRVSGKRIARLGEHPAGFDTCAYDAEKLKNLAGVEVDARDLDDLFEAGAAARADDVGTCARRSRPPVSTRSTRSSSTARFA